MSMRNLTSESMKLEMHGMKSEIAELRAKLTLAEKKRKELRDYFAGCVAVGIMRTCDEIHDTVVSRDDIAMEAYRMADAMLKAREG